MGVTAICITKIIICGFWKDPERDCKYCSQFTSKISILPGHENAAELPVKELAKVISLSFTSTR